MTMTSTSSKRDRALKIALSALLLVSLSFTGGLFYLKSKAAAAPQVGFPKPPDPALIARTEDAKREQALALRSKLEPWAKAHQAQLATMLRAQPNDTTALNTVTILVPSVPSKEKTGVDLSDLGGADNPGDAAVVQTQWTHLPVGAKAASPELEAGARDAEQKVLKRDAITFSQKRDVVLVDIASVWSNKQYFLWASGRVTQAQTEAPELNAKDEQIAPPYDFLAAPDKGASTNGS